MKKKSRQVSAAALVFGSLVTVPFAFGQPPVGTPPLRQLPARYSYAAKFVCGWAGPGAFRFTPVPPLRHTEPGHYSTIVNIHNPSPMEVTILKKVVVSAPEHQVQVPADEKDAALSKHYKNQTPPLYPTIRFEEKLQSDQAISVDCIEIENLLGLVPPQVTSTALFHEGYVVVEAFLPKSPSPAEPKELDVTTVTTTAALRLTASAPTGGGRSEFPSIFPPTVVFDQISLDHEVTIVPGRLLAAGDWPEGGPRAPDPPMPPVVTVPPTPPLSLYVCNELTLDLGHYGIGYLTTHPQFCNSISGQSQPPDPGAARVMVGGITVATQVTHPPIPNTPWGTNKPMYRCNFSNFSSAFYGVGLLVTHPQFCANSGPPIPPPQPVPATIAIPIGWNVGNDPVYRCVHATQDLMHFYGIGTLTTHPQLCDNLAVFPPSPVPAAVATDTTFKVP